MGVPTVAARVKWQEGAGNLEFGPNRDSTGALGPGCALLDVNDDREALRPWTPLCESPRPGCAPYDVSYIELGRESEMPDTFIASRM